MATARLQPRKTPVQTRGRETAARILEAAARVFAEWGYSAGTTNRIAEAAGMSVGSLYQYFPNKDAILVALVRRHVDDGARAVAERWDAVAGAPGLAERVGLLVDAAIANHRDSPRLHQVLFEEAPRPPELLAELHRMEAGLVAEVGALLRAEPTVNIPDAELAAWMAVAAVESLVHRFISTHPDEDLPAFREELIRLVVRYLTTSEETR